MGTPESEPQRPDGLLEGFSLVSPTKISWNSRKRTAANGRSQDQAAEEILKTPIKTDDHPATTEKQLESAPPLSDRRKALFEPLEPTMSNGRRKRPSAESLLPPPDFDTTSYPRGWLVGKKRKLVNVDVVESMRRIAIQEMNRKDREIDGLNEQLEEDARCLEHLQLQFLQEKSKRAEVERENAMLQEQVSMLMNMLHENENDGMEDEQSPPDDS